MKQEQMQGHSAQIKNKSAARVVDGNSCAPTLRPGSEGAVGATVPPTFAFDSLAKVEIARTAAEYVQARRERDEIPSDLIDTVRRDSSRVLIAATVASFEAEEDARAAIATLTPAESSPPTARQGQHLADQLRIAATRTDAPPALLAASPAHMLAAGVPASVTLKDGDKMPVPPVRRTRPSLQSIQIAVSSTNPEVQALPKKPDPSRSAPTRQNVRPVKAPKSAVGGYAAFAMGAAIACGALIFSRTTPATAEANAPVPVVAAAAPIEQPMSTTNSAKADGPLAAMIELDPVAAQKLAAATSVVAARKKTDSNDDQDVGSLLRRASTAVRQGSSADAKTLYLRIVSADPKNSEAWNGLGQIARASGNMQDATTAFTRALASNPRFLPAALAMADMAFAAGNHEEAVTMYRDLADHFPNDLLPGYVAERAH